MSKIHFQFKHTKKPYRTACGVLTGRIFLSSDDWAEVTCNFCQKKRAIIERANKYANNNTPAWHDFYIGDNANQHEMSKKDIDRHKDISGQVKLGIWVRGNEAYKGQFKV